MKRIKWILLIILIISIIVTTILFINFVRDKKTSSNNIQKENTNTIDLNSINNKSWYIKLLTIDKDGEILFRNDSYENIYIVITEENLKYCYSAEEECKIDNYIFNNNRIYIIANDTIGSGEYKIEFENQHLKFSRKEKDKTITYYFEEAKG